MTIETKEIRNALVFRDKDLPHRWYNAIGPNVAKYVTEFTVLPADDSTTDPTEFVCTVVEAGAGVSTSVLADVAGGALLTTTAADEDDGWSMQLGNANSGEWLSYAAQYPTYFGVQLAINDVDQTDLFVGSAVTDTALLGGVTDGMYFRSVDGSAVVNFVLEKDSVETSTAVATMTDASYIYLEWLYWGSNIQVYVNGVLVATVADTDTNFPNDELLRLSYEFLTGEAVANNCTLKCLRLIQLQG
ncbi:MAG: hypothetical protein GY832_03840 [Chloroflexi bacterium]|nr:hypothetical protein [Chloroflexota bacterium]